MIILELINGSVKVIYFSDSVYRNLSMIIELFTFK